MFIDMVSNVGLMSAAALLVFLIVARTGIGPGDLRVRLVTGLIFGVIAVLVVKVPVTIALGATFDTRAAPVVLSGVFGGPAAAVVAASIAGLARWQVGGPAVYGGIVSCLVYGAIGCAVHGLMRRSGRTALGAHGLAAVGAASVVLVLPCFFIGQPVETGVAILGHAWHVVLIGNVAGMLILGLMTEELQWVLRERDALRAAQSAAVAGLEAKSRFISAVSHDMRTPLNGMLGMLQILDHDGLPEADRERVRMARRAGRYLLDLVNQILDFAHLESGAVESVMRPFTLGELSESLAAVFVPIAETKGLQLVMQLEDDGAPRLEGDYDHLRQVLFNLVGNAVRYTSDGSVVVSATVSAQGAGRAAVTFSVSDTGPGVPEPERDRIFEEFIRLGEGTGDSAGSGLGLSIARALVAHLGGRLDIESEVGVGSRFYFTVPLGRRAEDAAPDGAAPPEATLPTGLRILVVDDVEINRSLLEEGLARAGHQVDSAESGAEAVAAVMASPTGFDAILMDIQMPGMTGDEAARAIREQVPAARDLPIVAVTANAFPEQRERYLAAGMTTVVTKPVDLEEINRLLGRLVAAGAGGRAAPIATAADRDDASLVDRAQFATLVQYLSVDRVPDLLDRALGQLEAFVGRLDEDVPPSHRARIAHQIKGTAANFGMTRLARAAACVEAAASRGDAAAEEIGALKEVMPPTRRAVSDLVRRTA